MLLDPGLLTFAEDKKKSRTGFEMGDPSRPYVAGSLFHRDSAKGAAEENTIKSMITRSGHTVEFNDDEKGGEWGITIKDAEGCVMHINTKEKSIHIEAPELMSFKAKNMKFEAEEDIELTAENSIEVYSKGTSKYAADDNMEIFSSADIEETAKGKITVNASQDLELAGMNSTVEAQNAMSVKGMQTTVEGKMTTIQGAAHKLDVM